MVSYHSSTLIVFLVLPVSVCFGGIISGGTDGKGINGKGSQPPQPQQLQNCPKCEPLTAVTCGEKFPIPLNMFNNDDGNICTSIITHWIGNFFCKYSLLRDRLHATTKNRPQRWTSTDVDTLIYSGYTTNRAVAEEKLSSSYLQQEREWTDMIAFIQRQIYELEPPLVYHVLYTVIYYSTLPNYLIALFLLKSAVLMVLKNHLSAVFDWLISLDDRQQIMEENRQYPHPPGFFYRQLRKFAIWYKGPIKKKLY